MLPSPLVALPVAAMMIESLGSLFRAKTVMLLMLMPADGAEVGEGDPGRPVGVGGQEVGGLPDAAAGAGGVDGVTRGVGGIHRDRADLARPPLPLVLLDRRRADRRPGFAREGVGLAEREDPEAGGDVIAAGLAQAGGRQRLLEAQRPTVERSGAASRRGVRR